MPRYKTEINTIYVSERMQECMRHISESAITTVIAPMGYGKSTAINWFLEQQEQDSATVLRINIYTNIAGLFWQSFKKAFENTPLRECLEPLDFPVGAVALGLLKDLLRGYLTANRQSHYLFIDDYHLMEDQRVTEMFLAIAALQCPHVHIILASRDEIITNAQVLFLGNRLHRIKTSDLQLNPTELSIYSRRCGVSMSSQQLTMLNKLCEGWFSVVYLNLKHLSEHGSLLLKSDNIYEMMSDSFSLNITNRYNRFLVVMSLSDEFTLDEAAFITQEPDVLQIAVALTAKNAFVRLLSDGKTYRIHHILKECAATLFGQLPHKKQQDIQNRFGAWYEKKGQYIRAFSFYSTAGNPSAILRMFALDGGQQLSILSQEALLSWLDRCTDEELKQGLTGLPCLMRRLYAIGQITLMRKIVNLLLVAVDESDLSEVEKNNMRGECSLSLSFLQYNDIAAMSVYHKKASELMSRISVDRSRRGTWTFGMPSVLMMFHRESGKMSEELCAMQEAIPYYYQVTDGHGKGAEYVMEAEVNYLRGEFTDARIALDKAVLNARGTKQHCIILCALFLKLRMMLGGICPYEASWKTDALSELQLNREPTLITMLDATTAFYYALSGDYHSIPDWFASNNLDSANILKPARPVYEVIEQQVLLAQKEYTQVISRHESLIATSDVFFYTLCTLHFHIQAACAYHALGKILKAREQLEIAITLAEPDECVMPFVENYTFLKPLLTDFSSKFIQKIIDLATDYEVAKNNIARVGTKREAFDCLTDMEYNICCLMVERHSNQSIAKQLFLSEGTVRQYINKIYTKLGVEGNTTEKRKQIFEYFCKY